MTVPIIEQGGSKAAVEVAEFWMNYKWNDIREAWGTDFQGVLVDSFHDFHLNMATTGALVRQLSNRRIPL